MTTSQHLYEVRPRKDHRGVDQISDALPFDLVRDNSETILLSKSRMIRHNSPMTPLLSDSSPASGRIRRNNSVKYCGKIPSISR